MVNEWVNESLKRKGIILNSDGTLEISFIGKVQKVKNIETAIRQQTHIVEQQQLEQKENTEIGLLVNDFKNIVESLSKMTVDELSINMKDVYMSELTEIIHTMSTKREDLRKDALLRLANIYKMIEKNNLPAALWASYAAIDRMRKRWLVNDKVIDKASSRLQTLMKISDKW